jgi:riboflavin kinase/FMN adenylyltransferase
VNVARSPAELARVPRAVAVGTFDGVHVGHRAVVRAAVEARLRPTVVTFDPHPRTVLGRAVELLSTLARRLELLASLGVEDTLVVPFTRELAGLPPESFAREYLAAIGTELVVAGSGFRFGHRRAGDLALLETLGFDVRPVPLVDGVSSTEIRQLVHAGEVRGAARLLARAVETDGTVVSGDARGAGLGFPTANLHVEPGLLVAPHGIYAGAAMGHRAAVSIGVNPHYGGSERKIEAFILEFDGDLYGKRLVVELWDRLREQRAFASEAELVHQIGADVDAARTATPPV